MIFIKNMQPTWQPGAGHFKAGCQKGKLSGYVIFDDIIAKRVPAQPCRAKLQKLLTVHLPEHLSQKTLSSSCAHLSGMFDPSEMDHFRKIRLLSCNV